MDSETNANSLFETPPGVWVIPASLLIDDAEATVILDAGDLEESEQLLAGFDPEATIRNTRGPVPIHAGRPTTAEAARYSGPVRTVRATPRMRPICGRALAAASGPGAWFVYALVLMTATLGVVGLALSWQDPRAAAVAGLFATAAGILLWVFWRSWLGGFPYVYRLLTSLGEDAENLIHWRLIRRRSVRIGSLYR